MPPADYLSPRAVADLLRLAKTDAVLSWIARGELAAANVSSGPGRPTWRISRADLEAFLDRRRAAPMPSVRRIRRPRQTTVTRYF